MARERKWFWSAVVLGLLVVAGAVALPAGLEVLARGLIEQDLLQGAEAILVLQGDDERGSRVAHAVRLFKDGYASLLVLSGKTIAWETNSADIMRRQALALGVRELAIVEIRHESDSTKEEAAAVLPELIKHRIKRVILVTSSYHTRRAKRTFRTAPGGDRFEWMVSPAPDLYFNPDRWWTRRRDARTVFYEGTKTLWYLVVE